MEIDLGLAVAVGISSAAGWYMGHRFERKRAIEAIHRVQKVAIMGSVRSTSEMLQGAIEIFGKYIPEMTQEKMDSTVKEFISACNTRGLNLQVMTEAQAKKMGIQEILKDATTNRSDK